METENYSITKHGPVEIINLYHKIPGTTATSHLCVFRIGNTLVDTGSVNTAPVLVQLLKEHPPRQIILTHQHEDHVGGLTYLQKFFGDIPVYCPEEFTDIISQANYIPGYREKFWGDFIPFENLIPYNDSAEFTEKKIKIIPVMVPGHTPGQRALLVYDKKKLYAITADLYLAPKLHNAWMETSVPDMINSLQKIIDLKPDLSLPSHGRIVEDTSLKFGGLRDWYLKETEIFTELSDKLQTTDYVALFRSRFGSLNTIEKQSSGELSRFAFIRGIFYPVKSLPADRIVIPPDFF